MGKRLAVTLYPVASGGSALSSLYNPVLVRAMHALAATWYPERRFWVSKLKPPEQRKYLPARLPSRLNTSASTTPQSTSSKGARTNPPAQSE
jgi:hypothetical protein